MEFEPSNRKIFCSHGAYPFIYRKRFTYVADEFEKAWNVLGMSIEHVDNPDELVYEDNTSFNNMNPSDYINHLYDELGDSAQNMIEDPRNIHYCKNIIDKIRAVQNNDETAKNELSTHPMNQYLRMFIAKWNYYKACQGRFIKARNNVHDLRAYMLWGDLYAANATKEEMEPLKTVEDWTDFFKLKGTEFVQAERFEVKRFNLCYPEQLLIDWMNKNEINVYLRGHETTSYLHRVRDLNSKKEWTPDEPLKFEASTRLYACFHSTASYKENCPEYFGTPCVATITGCEIKFVQI